MKDYKIMGINLPVYLGLLAVLIVAIVMDVLPAGMIGAFAFMMIIGALLDVIGNNTPIIKTYFGGGPIVVIFGSAALVYFNVLPESVVKNVNTFMKGGGFLDFYIAALITGSILGMNKKLLIKGFTQVLPDHNRRCNCCTNIRSTWRTSFRSVNVRVYRICRNPYNGRWNGSRCCTNIKGICKRSRYSC